MKISKSKENEKPSFKEGNENLPIGEKTNDFFLFG